MFVGVGSRPSGQASCHAAGKIAKTLLILKSHPRDRMLAVLALTANVRIALVQSDPSGVFCLGWI